MDFFESIKDERAKNEELADAAQFLVGLKKQAYYPAPCGPMDGSPAKGWISLFEGSPLLQQALSLERMELTMEAEDIAKRQQERAEGDARMKMDQQRWDQRDQIRIKKKELELQLAEQQMGGVQPGEEGALPKSEAGAAPAVVPAHENGDMPKLANLPALKMPKTKNSGMTNSEVAPSSGGSDPPATVPGTGMSKMSLALPKAIKNLSTPKKGALAGGAYLGGLTGLGAAAGPSKKENAKALSKREKALMIAGNTAMGAFAGHQGGKMLRQSNIGGLRRKAGAKKLIQSAKQLDSLGEQLKRRAKASDIVKGQPKLSPRKVIDLPESAVTSRKTKHADVADVVGKVMQYKHTPAIAGALVGGGLLLNASRPRKDLKGRSKDEVESDQNAQAAKGTTPKSFPGKMSKHLTESMPGFSKILREHPGMATLLGAGAGANAGKGLAEIIGRGAEKVQKLQAMRRQLSMRFV